MTQLNRDLDLFINKNLNLEPLFYDTSNSNKPQSPSSSQQIGRSVPQSMSSPFQTSL